MDGVAYRWSAAAQMAPSTTRKGLAELTALDSNPGAQISMLENEIPNKMHMSDERSYRPDIDGIRAIAILSVVLYHAGVPMLSGGFTGVDIFFVISGYLIGGHILSELCSGAFSFLRFYKRRAKRILPAFYVVIAFAILTAIILLSPFEANEFAKEGVTSIVSASNIYFARSSNYFQTKSELYPLLMTWSLGVEEQFYAVIPLLMALLARMRRGLILPAILVVCALSFVIATRELNSHPDMAFYSLPARAWELGVGVALAVAELSWKRKLLSARWTQAASLMGFALMLVPMHLLTSGTPFPGVAALPSVLGTALVIAAPVSWINRRLLSLSPLVFVGKISYSWYLWHWPLLAFMRIASGGTLRPYAVAVAIAVSLGMAFLSYHFIEQPFRRSSRAPTSLLIRYAAVSLGFVVVCAVLLMSHGLPKRYPALIQEGEMESHSCLASYGSERPDLSSHCYAASDPRPSVVLWGDSHSAALAPAVRQAANTEGYNFIQMTKASCLPLTGVAKSVPQHPLAASECVHFNNTVLNLIVADSRIRIVIMAGRWADPFRDGGNIYPLYSLISHTPELHFPESVRSEFAQSLSASIRVLQNASKRVIVFDDVPFFDFDPWSRFQTAHIPARLAVAIWLGADTDNPGLAPASSVSAANMSADVLSQTLEGISGVELVDLKSKFCNNKNLCAYMDGDRMLYLDEQHLTAEGARYALRNFRFPIDMPQ